MHSGQQWREWVREFRATLALAMPIVAGMLSHTLIGLVDTVMVGRLGVTPLAAAAFVNVIIHPGLVFSVGMLSAVAVLSAQAFGAKEPRACGEALRNGILISLLLGLINGAMWHLLLPFLSLTGQDDQVIAASREYLLIYGWSILPALLTHACKQFAESLNRAWVPNAILLGSVALNAFLNWILIFGHFGAASLGLEGAGWATLFARIIALALMVTYILWEKEFRPYLPKRWFCSLELAAIKKMLRVGGPVSLQHLVEVGAFAFAALMMGRISPAALAAHQIAITCAATTFMFAMGIGMATCIRVGQAWGAGELHQVRRIGFLGMALGGGTMSACGLVLLSARYPIVQAFSSAPEVVAIGAQLFFVAALFQLADGLQVSAISALRGVSDVRIPAAVAILAYWIVALPAGYLLAFRGGYGPVGIWIGLAIGLGVAAWILTWRFHTVSRTENHAFSVVPVPDGSIE